MTFPTLETERLILAELVDSDIDALFEIFSHESVVKYYDLEVFDNVSEAGESIDLFRNRFNTSQGIRWGIRKKETNVLIGTCGFNSWSRRMRNAVIGYELHPAHWRQGYATEAVGEILQAAFSGKLSCGPLHRVQADTMPGNEASEQLLLSLGFKFEGILRGSGYWKNQYHDLKCFGLLADEFTK